MAIWTPYLLIYLAGIATPIFLIRQLLRKRDNEGACLMDMILVIIIIISIAALALGWY